MPSGPADAIRLHVAAGVMACLGGTEPGTEARSTSRLPHVLLGSAVLEGEIVQEAARTMTIFGVDFAHFPVRVTTNSSSLADLFRNTFQIPG